MSTAKSYSYVILRYVHDIGSGEFINVGVAILCPDDCYASALCRPTYGRISKVFPDMNKEYFKAQMRHIQAQFEELGDRLSSELPLESSGTIEKLAHGILPADDSSLQWSPIGFGTTADPAATLDHLFDRYIMRYEDAAGRERRTNDDVWRSFRRTLESRQLLQHFESRRVAVADDAIEFEHCWQNGILHCLEPVSFDLADADGIRDKAHRWLGRITSISAAPDRFRVYFLTARPQDEALQGAYENALNILREIPSEKEIYPEQSAEELGARIAEELAQHQVAG
jgi:hypothetical protein